jgi:hypothetical protein
MNVRNPMYELMRAASMLGGRESEAARIERDGQDAYELRVYRDCIRLATVFEEAEQLSTLLGRAETFQQIRAVLKMYIMSWSTLWDAAANIIDQVLQLHLHSRGINWTVVSKHPSVVQSKLLEPLSSREGPLERAKFVSLRNDIAHRGWLVDPDYDALHGEWLFAAVMATVRAPNERVASALEEAAQQVDIRNKMSGLIRIKRQELDQHLTLTFEALEIISRGLEAELRKRCAA